MKRCYWWNRWYHRRQRQVDRICVSPQFQGFGFEADHDMWEAFTEDVGQEHWRCQCACDSYADQWGEVRRLSWLRRLRRWWHQ